jgi:DNA-binding MarR family transcriptional regulator
MASGIPPDRVTDRPGYLLKRAQAALHAGMANALREHGATLAQYAVLTALDEEPGLSNAGLARRAFVTPQTMNQVLRELEQKGWVTRHPHPGHARILQADLTQVGRAALRACHRGANVIEEQMLTPLTPGECQQFATTLRACIEALSEQRNRESPYSVAAFSPGGGPPGITLRSDSQVRPEGDIVPR